MTYSPASARSALFTQEIKNLLAYSMRVQKEDSNTRVEARFGDKLDNLLDLNRDAGPGELAYTTRTDYGDRTAEQLRYSHLSRPKS